MAVGAVLGSVLAWRLGTWLGPTGDLIAHARAVGAKKVFDGPLALQAKGALLAWPIGAVLTHLLLTTGFGPRDEQPPTVHWTPPPAGMGAGARRSRGAPAVVGFALLDPPLALAGALGHRASPEPGVLPGRVRPYGPAVQGSGASDRCDGRVREPHQ